MALSLETYMLLKKIPNRAEKAADKAEAAVPDDYSARVYGAFPHDSISNASVATFADGADNIPVRDLTVSIVPVQTGSGDPSPGNVRPISGWTGAKISCTGKNLIGGIEAANRIAAGADTYTIDTTSKTIAFKTIAGSGGSLLWSGDRSYSAYFPFKPNTAYTVIGRMNKSGGTGAFGLGFTYSDGTTKQFKVSDTDAQEYLVMSSDPTKTLTAVYVGYTAANNQVVYYDTLGIYEGTLTKADAEAFVGTVYPVSWQSEVGTVYGGTLDVTTGVLTVTHIGVDMGTIPWGRATAQVEPYFTSSLSDAITFATGDADLMCSCYKPLPNMVNSTFGNSHDTNLCITGRAAKKVIMVKDTDYSTEQAFAAAVNGQYVVYPLAEPQTVQLSATEVKTLLGNNNIWADCGNVSVDYRADKSLYIAKKLAE